MNNESIVHSSRSLPVLAGLRGNAVENGNLDLVEEGAADYQRVIGIDILRPTSLWNRLIQSSVHSEMSENCYEIPFSTCA